METTDRQPAREDALVESAEKQCDIVPQKGANDNQTLQEPAEMTTRLKLLLLLMAFTNFCSTTAFSCIAPFFPREAEVKGLSTTQIGIIFGIFELTIFVMSPIWGKLMPRIGSKFMFVTGLVLTGLTSVLFGVLMWVPSGWPFFVVAMIVRVLEAVGAAGYTTASFAICAHVYSGQTIESDCLIIGILETFTGLGFATGPPIGSVLYEVGGYNMPFSVLGGILLLAAVLSSYALPAFKEVGEDEHDFRAMFRLLRVPSTLVMVYTIASVAISLTFIEPTLEPHLRSFNFRPTTVGLTFLLMSGTYSASAPVWGHIADKRRKLAPQLMILSALVCCGALLLVGPSPVLPIAKHYWIICLGLAIIGVAIGGLLIPTFQLSLSIAREHGYGDNLATYGIVSGLFQSSFSFGGFFGPTLGSFTMDRIGFPWTCTIVAGLLLVDALLLVGEYINRWHRCHHKAKPLDAKLALLT